MVLPIQIELFYYILFKKYREFAYLVSISNKRPVLTSKSVHFWFIWQCRERRKGLRGVKVAKLAQNGRCLHDKTVRERH